LKEENLLQNASISKLLTPLLAACAALVLTACGGGSYEDDPMMADNTAHKSNVSATAARSAKTIDTFGNFNPAIWDQHNWYECNCARNPDITPPTSTPWKAAS
jgi:hypothetical protein